LFDIAKRDWSEEMCALFGVPRSLLPKTAACDAHFGDVDAAHFGRAIPIHGMAGDQQAALVGHGCFKPGMAKCTFGTGAFLVMNMGAAPPRSNNRLLATLGYQVGNSFAYALEGSIFSAGATMQWLRDGLKLIQTSAESEAIATRLTDNGGVYLVPAFAGLGAPQWSAEARGAIVGLTRDTRAEHLVRAGLEAVAYQSADLLDALRADGAANIESLLVDGGLTANGWAMQFLADICEVKVARPEFQEVTALGAARLAASGAGLRPLDQAQTAGARMFAPRMHADQRRRLRRGWAAAVAGALAVAKRG
jgi:glycerol kinase